MKKKQKILYVMHMPPPIHGASIMGRYVHESDLINQTFDCRFINLSASSELKDIGRLSIRKVKNMSVGLIKVLKLIREYKPEVCYLTPSSSGLAFYRDFLWVQSIKLMGVKIVLHFHNKAHPSWVSKSFNRFLLRRFYDNVKIILLGKQLYSEKEPFLAESEVYYLPNGVPSMASESPMQSNKGNKAMNFLFLSNMIEEKGVYILLEACRILKELNYIFKCDFVGQYKDVSETDFNNMIKTYGLQDEARARGPQYGNEKNMFFEQADVFVFPTHYQDECFPLVLLEAMDYSLPCISTINGAIPSVIEEGQTGYCIPQKDIECLVDRMIWMIENPKARIMMGAKGKERFHEKFTLNIFEKQLVNIFNDVIGKNDITSRRNTLVSVKQNV
ncbi:glycosyltransferase involved in cell wall biosynthesis [Flavobacteriaceae bacterium MAR_2009_75]|nr:glycosyltransferase involved in cell wall biosynthesis [Flavobacteriaceae bacterium MAR_2009_75]